ncbi:hypothetical protein A3D03_02360 [Candidatus Gottesmanbacteria bacterium RIFCSPHIGHO2_02_FULL_40_13]|uniref:Glycosyltransferase RgtA/B/C/D-like domain-containing protein n=1 Tax=Candidatus Gottesmanbacteria bacterium RIFCSPHIGHO2_02_FULL_40_13 TaxID=1798384 RepID=A0A1F6A9T9_9BACT|nr:MAG: hypothetical protein A3D03_02360 [Candidatus Gottesmanbacteria bacterium RIFCSPHIGHO2_02_FULL_40_13]
MKKILSDTIKNFFYILFPFIVIFLGTIYPSGDSDLGWHLKYGEYFFRTGKILRENTLSTMMPGFTWINSSWGTDLISYLIFHFSGFWGLSLTAALIIALILYIFKKSFKLSFWEISLLFPIILYMEQPMFAVSFRGQLLSFLGLAVLYYLLVNYQNGRKKMIFFCLPLFWLWSNIHGEFILGLGIFFLWAVAFILSKISFRGWKNIFSPLKEYLDLILSFILSVFAAVINPFGWEVYHEAVKHFNNPALKDIIEWISFERFSLLWWNLVIWEILIMLSILIHLEKKKLKENLPWLVPTFLILIMSYLVRRYNWVLLLISIPVVRIFFQTIRPKKRILADILSFTVLGGFYFYVISFQIPLANIFHMDWDRYCTDFVKCSPKSVEYVANNKLAGDDLLTFYNWGGWIIWNYPEVKPGIDGRMHLWRDDKGYSAFDEYYPLEQNIKDIDNSRYSKVLINTSKPLYKKLIKLVDQGRWKLLYRDDLAAVFSKNIVK